MIGYKCSSLIRASSAVNPKDTVDYSIIAYSPCVFKALQRSDVPLNDYAKFISCVKMNQRKGLPVAEAVDAAMEMAISENLLDGYFAAHKAEVIGMILTEYDEEFVHKGWYQDGLEKGITQEKQNTVRRMTAAGFNAEQIAAATDLPIEQIPGTNN